MKPLSIALFIFLYTVANAQDYKRAQNWYFGDSAGLSFATDPPTVLTNGSMLAGEGCATMSDTNGNLLFYTNGVTVWNKNHQIMDNGTGLNGHISSTQSSLIVPWPSNDSLYYIFTTDAIGKSKGLQYSLVNINENNGIGKVIVKNILLQTPVCEKLAATSHANETDYWVIARGFNNNNHYSYLINGTGLVNCPVITSIGPVLKDIADAQGEIKFSVDGKKIVEAVYSLSYNRVDLFSFNKETGAIFNEINIPNITLPYSVEFSPKGSQLYVTNRLNYIYQYDLASASGANIRNSQHQIYFSGNTLNNYHGIIQKGTDNKLYIGLLDSTYLSLITYPEKKGDSCGFILRGISILRKGTFGLPNFVSSYFYRPRLDFTYFQSCFNDSIYFQAKGGNTPTWHMYRNKAIIHTTNQPSTGFNFLDTGEYIIQLVSGNDTVTKTIHIEPKLKLGQDTILCNQPAYTLKIPANYRCIMWQDGADSASYTINQSGKYYARAYNNKGCLVVDTINVTFKTLSAPLITKRNDSLYTDSGNYTYIWYYENTILPATAHQLKISKNGSYRVEITDNNGCTNTSAPFLVKGLNIELFNAQDFFSIYPNPSSNYLFIDNIQNIAIQSIKLHDITGRVYSFQPAQELSLKGLSKGIYYLGITDIQNHQYTTKIIIN